MVTFLLSLAELLFDSRHCVTAVTAAHLEVLIDVKVVVVFALRAFFSCHIIPLLDVIFGSGFFVRDELYGVYAHLHFFGYFLVS